MKITRDVISDLWPLYAAGEATADTRTLVEEFLAGDAEFAHLLRQRFELPPEEVTLPPDRETRALARTRDLVMGRWWLRVLRSFAVVCTCIAVLSFLRGDDEGALAMSCLAAIAWFVTGAILHTLRHRALRVAKPHQPR